MVDTRKLYKKNRIIQGLGINDADYAVSRNELVGGKLKQVWVCPYYSVWKSIFQRCYSPNAHEKYPTYVGCTVDESWKLFSNFREWMVDQPWENNQIDKDILQLNNKIYSAHTCVFVSTTVNQFIRERTKASEVWPIGVRWRPELNRFAAGCSNPFTGKIDYLGLHTCPESAHNAWLDRKTEYAIKLASLQQDQRVAEALIDRYLNYK